VRVAVLMLAATVLVGACGNDGSTPGAVVEGTEIVRSTTTTIPPAPHLFTTTSIAVELLPPTEIRRSQKVDTWSWTGQRTSSGTIHEIQPLNGGWLMSFANGSGPAKFFVRSPRPRCRDRARTGCAEHRHARWHPTSRRWPPAALAGRA